MTSFTTGSARAGFCVSRQLFFRNCEGARRRKGEGGRADIAAEGGRNSTIKHDEDAANFLFSHPRRKYEVDRERDRRKIRIISSDADKRSSRRQF